MSTTAGHRSIRRTVIALVVALSLPGMGCSETNQRAGGGDGGERREAGAALDALYAELEGLDPEARRSRLIELAAEEQEKAGAANLYGTTNLDEAEPILAAFEDETDLEVNLYRADAGDILQRVLQEAQADFAGADVVYMNGPEMTVLDGEGLLAPLETPVTDPLPEVAVFDNWAAVYLNLFIASWNTNNVAASQAPTTWEEVLADYPGNLAIEAGDFDWFATLVGQYFQEQKGMTEDEAIEVFRRSAESARAVDGHTLMAELLAAGEFDVAASVYRHRIGQLQRDGAPVEWEPAVEPLIVRPNGIGIISTTTRPAQALLFTEFMLTDVQEMLLEFDRTPASPAAPGGGVPQGNEVLLADLELLFDEREKWETLWEEIVASSGNVVED